MKKQHTSSELFFQAGRQRRMAFTLIELLVVIAIIGILAGLLVPVISRAKDKARTAQCASNLRQMGLAMTMYFADHNDRYPLITWWNQYNQYFSLTPYLGKSQQPFICPSAHGKTAAGFLSHADYPKLKPHLTITNADGSTWVTEYKFNDNLRLNWSTNSAGDVLDTKHKMSMFSPTEFVVALDGTDWAPRHAGFTRVNMGFLDGHVKLIQKAALYDVDSKGSYPFWNWGFPEKTED